MEYETPYEQKLYEKTVAILNANENFDYDRKLKLSKDTNLRHVLGLDSIDMCELGLALEKACGVSLRDGEINQSQTIDDTVQLLKRRKANV